MFLSVPFLLECSSVYLSHQYTNLTRSYHLPNFFKNIILSVTKGFQLAFDANIWIQVNTVHAPSLTCSYLSIYRPSAI